MYYSTHGKMLTKHIFMLSNLSDDWTWCTYQKRREPSFNYFISTAVTIASIPWIMLNRVLQKLWQHFASIKAEPKGWIWFHRSWSRSKGRVCGARETGFSLLCVVIGARWELTSPEASANHVPVCECEWVTSGLERVWVARRRIQQGGLRRAKSCLYNPG